MSILRYTHPQITDLTMVCAICEVMTLCEDYEPKVNYRCSWGISTSTSQLPAIYAQNAKARKYQLRKRQVNCGNATESVGRCERDVLEFVATALVTSPTARRAIRDEVAVVGQRPHVQPTTLYAAEEQPLFARCHIHTSSLSRTQPSGGPESGVVIQRKPRP